MRIPGTVIVAALIATGTSAGETRRDSLREVRVCMNPGGNASTVFRAEATASRIFERLGLKMVWHGDPRSCTAPNDGIVIILVGNTPADRHPGALAYATLSERTVVVFHDRVQAAAIPPLQAHVLIHEITHILQGVVRHSETGMMKSSWDHRDYVNMDRSLPFTDQDVRLIHRGLDIRTSQVSGRASPKAAGSK